MNRVVVLGTGGREHALAWACAREVGVENIGLHPGNPGALKDGYFTLGDVSPTSSAALIDALKKHKVDLVVIGPEDLLALDLATQLRAAGFLVVGPSQSGARLETSKIFSKEIMQRAGIPTADFSVASSAEELSEKATQFPCVLKYDGLAAGKGVVIAKTVQDVVDFSHRIWKTQEFGKTASAQVLVEAFLPGKEVSLIGFCDGHAFIPMATATDYKRIFDKDEGPNTGGMGAISPSPFEPPGLLAQVEEKIARPLLLQLKKEGIEYIGILYIGLMVDSQGTARVLEFNARFGDPETQALMMRIEKGFVQTLLDTAKRQLCTGTLIWSSQASTYVVAAAEGYPESPKTGDAIAGLEKVSAQVFFSGVSKKENQLLTQGGRVLGVGALGKDLKAAREKAYESLKNIHWRGIHFRKDIGLL